MVNLPAEVNNNTRFLVTYQTFREKQNFELIFQEILVRDFENLKNDLVRDF